MFEIVRNANVFRGRAAILLLPVLVFPAVAQERERSARIDVNHYRIQAEINPRTQTLAATTQVDFTAMDDDATALTFELNNALNVSHVVDGQGREIQTSRANQDSPLRLSLPESMKKGQTGSLTFTYDGRLSGKEDSPVNGIRFAAIHTDFSYLMYPARWFPVSGYTTNRFAADLIITVPAGSRVVASGDEKSDAAGDKTVFSFHFAKLSFPGSIAVVQGEPKKIQESGVVTSFYLRSRESVVKAYGEEIGKIMIWATSLYGLPPQANLTVVETENDAPSGYAAQGILFLSPRALSTHVNTRLLVNQITRQWYGVLVSPTTRNHLWLVNGQARYAELLYIEHTEGAGTFESEVKSDYVEALTVENPPLSQSARFEDYSPEYWAATAAKGAAVLNMLRGVLGDANFFKLVKIFPDEYAWKSASTKDFEKIAEKLSGENLQYFFLQWIDSSGAPEFKLEYTVFRTQKGFRVVGKVNQDLDTFHMPVDLKIVTEGNPETKRIDVVGTSSEFTIDTFGKPKSVTIDPDNRMLRFSNPIRVAVAIKKGEQFMEVGDFAEAIKEYQKALDVNKNSSLAQYRVAEVFFNQNNFQSAANAFRAALNGDLDPKWIETWAHLNLGKVFDITGSRDRAVNEYNLAMRTRDNTQGAQEEAAKYLKAPYERKQVEN
jgi:tetratricopeptide (TPR) repeat protein